MLIPKAAWSSSGTLKFYRHSRQKASAISSVISTQQQVNVSCDKIDNILKDLDISCVNFVRIQVNGAEHEVLNGMPEVLGQFPTLLIAAIYERYGEASWKKIMPFLENRGYATQRQRGNVFAIKRT